MVFTDPFTSDESRYECRECGHRSTTDRHPGTCPQCDAPVTNLAVCRE